MRTRNQAKSQNQSAANKESAKHYGEMESRSSCRHKASDDETLANISRGAVGKLLKRVNKSCDSRGSNKDDSYLCKQVSTSKIADSTVAITESDVLKSVSSEVDNEADDLDWEDGSVYTLKSETKLKEDAINGVTVEFDALPDPSKLKTVRRATAEEKELAELVHKVNLLCLLARGRLIDSACDDPLLKASLLSLLPPHLLNLTDVPKLTAKALAPLVSWFHSHFGVKGLSETNKSFQSSLASTLASQEGTAEEVTALSVALFRALNIPTRFVSILDVASLKPEIEKPYPSGQGASRARNGIFNSSTPMVAGSKPEIEKHYPLGQGPNKTCNGIFNSSTPMVAGSLASMKLEIEKPYPFGEGPCMDHNGIFNSSTLAVGGSKGSPLSFAESMAVGKRSLLEPNDHRTDTLNKRMLNPSTPEARQDVTNAHVTKTAGLKRRGDLEFQMQLEMALSATSASNMVSENVSLFKKKKIKAEEECSTSSSSHGISTAVGSRKVGPPLYWAEVYCSGENLTGKWVHVDVVNAITDGEKNVEATAAVCKLPLRYVVAFAGNGAKDVTRRYCIKWHKIASERVNSIWWGEVLAPLKQLELVGTIKDSSIEDLELETRTLTEPFPTNQQAYKNHHIYVLERWLNKNQILHPKGPVLGFCSGHPVYPRSCVQTLLRKERWLREGLQLKANESPAKVLKRSEKKNNRQDVEDDDFSEGDCGGTIALYGRWQTEPLVVPPALNGIVPRNERGQVDVWSEKCLPPGTVHLRFPRLVPVAKRLQIDFAPAMVGFEFRNGRSLPIYEGIVVCTEFKDAILEAYMEEEERRVAKERKRTEAEALSRWYQLLASLITRQRLENYYGTSSQSAENFAVASNDDTGKVVEENSEIAKSTAGPPPFVVAENHEHVFLVEDQIVDVESSTRTKRCRCGFSVQFEEL